MEQDDADRLSKVPLGPPLFRVGARWIGELLLDNDVHNEVVAQKLERSPGFGVNLLKLFGIYSSFLLFGSMVLVAQKSGLVSRLFQRVDILTLRIEEILL